MIGPEIREYLGLIRTQELLAARRIDGGNQFFTRANDFGYSKNPEETQEIWEREKVLSDVVWAFRKFKPDVIITRFPTDGRGGHGHHTTSAILAGEAFDMAANKSVFPEQLSLVEAWQPKRLYLNTGRWWDTSIDQNTPGVLMVDAGKYNPLLGTSYTEIAAVSRTSHKSQGFGSTGSRGEGLEFLEFLKGDQAKSDVFEGVNTSWNRVKGGAKVAKLMTQLITSFQPSSPEKSVPALIEIRKAILQTEDPYWKSLKLQEVNQLIRDCMGLYIETTASSPTVTPGETVEVSLEVTNRSAVSAKLKKVSSVGAFDKGLTNNALNSEKWQYEVPKNAEISQPYWLAKESSLGMYRVDDQKLIGTPENKPAIQFDISIEIEGQTIEFTTPLVYKWNDPVKGEQYRPFVITPVVYINLTEPVEVFNNESPREVSVVVKAGKNDIDGVIKPSLPNGWKAMPEKISVKLAKKGEEQRLVFNILPPKGESTGDLTFNFSDGNFTSENGLMEINYDHLPLQTVFPKSTTRVVKLDLKKSGQLIGYIHGAGDAIPNSLRNVGYEVWEMSDDEITTENLAKCDAVILGIRALNTRDRLNFVMDDLLNYVKSGGTMIVQYNTDRGLKVENFAPYPMKLSRDRVTREDSKVTILNPNHPAIKGANTITEADFSGWVQERGLYFPNEWSKEYEPLFSTSDPGEEDMAGSTLVAKYGSGYYIYTGLSWFRELPAGVPGAYRLFVNLVSIGKSPEVQKASLKENKK